MIPPADRTPNGYRLYSAVHAAALDAYVALIPGFGHAPAAEIMRAVNRGDRDSAFHLIDGAHAQLQSDRATLDAVESAIHDLVPEQPAADPADRNADRDTTRGAHPNADQATAHGAARNANRATTHGAARDANRNADLAADLAAGRNADHAAGRNADHAADHAADRRAEQGGPHPDRPLPIGAVAHRLGVTPATLRKWERAGILLPHRDRYANRVYHSTDLRDADLAHLLRRGGYPLAHIATVLDHTRRAGGPKALADSLADWRHRLSTRARAMLTGAAHLDAYLNVLDHHP